MYIAGPISGKIQVDALFIYLTGSHSPRYRCLPLADEETGLREVKKLAEGRTACRRGTDTQLCWSSGARSFPGPQAQSAVPCVGRPRWGLGPDRAPRPAICMTLSSTGVGAPGSRIGKPACSGTHLQVMGQSRNPMNFHPIP